MKKLLFILCLLLAMTGCNSNNNTETVDDTFTVGMECAYAPFNYQISSPSDTSV